MQTSIFACRKILVADRRASRREELGRIIRQLGPGVVAIEAADFAGLRGQLTEHADIDLVLVCAALPAGPSGGLAALLSDWPTVNIALLATPANPDEIRRGIEGGLVGFIPDCADADTVAAALGRILAGGVYLPPPAPHDATFARFAAPVQTQGEAPAQQFDSFANSEHDLWLKKPWSAGNDGRPDFGSGPTR